MMRIFIIQVHDPVVHLMYEHLHVEVGVGAVGVPDGVHQPVERVLDRVVLRVDHSFIQCLVVSVTKRN